MAPLAILGSIGVSLAIRVGVGLIASAARALLDASPASAGDGAAPARHPKSFAAHLGSAAGRLASRQGASPPIGEARHLPESLATPGRVAVENAVQALALGVRLRADSARPLSATAVPGRPNTPSLRG
jgi:hypothetical protein